MTKYPFLICWIYNHLVIGTNQFFSKFKWWPLIRMASWLANLKWLIKQLWIEVSVFFLLFFWPQSKFVQFFPLSLNYWPLFAVIFLVLSLCVCDHNHFYTPTTRARFFFPLYIAAVFVKCICFDWKKNSIGKWKILGWWWWWLPNSQKKNTMDVWATNDTLFFDFHHSFIQ